ncbi:MAG: hypothetical protein HKN91_05305 [Acidimicrobiia bacterium]|nr:hypothetical protein [Acidimicrobiia bacterium]
MGFSKRRQGAPAETDSERGANLVEFAVLAPLLLILIFGIIEFGYLFAQLNDVRHAVREGARYAAVDAGDEDAIAVLVCNTIEGVSGGMSNLVVSLTDGTTVTGPTTGTKGDTGAIAVSVDVASLSNLPIITSFLPTSLTADVQFRLEQDSELWDTSTRTPTFPTPPATVCTP